MVKNKKKKKKYLQQRKNSLAESRTYTICTEGRLLFRLLHHTAKNKGRQKIIIFKVLFQ